jgi:flagellar protein FlaG
MIDSVTVTSDNLVRNKGEGSPPPPPPSSSDIQQSESGQAAAEVDLNLRPPEQTETDQTRQAKGAAEQTAKLQQDAQSDDKDLDEQLKETINSLNEKLARLDRQVLFKLDQKINRNYISVVDKESKEIIREFPPEEIRTFIARFDEINEKLTMSSDIKSLIINLEV